MKTRIGSAGIALGLATLGFSAPTLAQPLDVDLQFFAVASDGCPPGSVFADYDAPTSAIDIYFSALVANTTGPQRQCEVIFRLDHAPGWNYGFSQATIYGSTEFGLSSGAGRLSATIYLGGQEIAAAHAELDSPGVSPFVLGPVLPSLQSPLLPCHSNRTFRILLDVRLLELPGELELDLLRVRPSWQRCTSVPL